jgi:hypothetical protein
VGERREVVGKPEREQVEEGQNRCVVIYQLNNGAQVSNTQVPTLGD